MLDGNGLADLPGRFGVPIPELQTAVVVVDLARGRWNDSQPVNSANPSLWAVPRVSKEAAFMSLPD